MTFTPCTTFERAFRRSTISKYTSQGRPMCDARFPALEATSSEDT